MPDIPHAVDHVHALPGRATGLLVHATGTLRLDGADDLIVHDPGGGATEAIRTPERPRAAVDQPRGGRSLLPGALQTQRVAVCEVSLVGSVHVCVRRVCSLFFFSAAL